MTEIKTILTHPGGAHKDEFLACALLLTLAPVPVFRREPSPQDLSDATVAVVDVGLRHEPQLRNFDHHQFPRETLPTCAFSLILQELGLYADAREFCGWLEVAEWFDCRGPVETAAWLNVDRNSMARLHSPLDITLLRRFADKNEHLPGEPIWELMRMIGQDLIDYITGLRARLDSIAEQSEIWEIETSGKRFKAAFVARTEAINDDPAAGLGKYVESLGPQSEVLALVYPDSRGAGYGLRRFNDDARLDFSKASEEPDVHFAHSQGFIAKTSATDPARLRALLELAWTGPRR